MQIILTLLGVFLPSVFVLSVIKKINRNRPTLFQDFLYFLGYAVIAIILFPFTNATLRPILLIIYIFILLKTFRNETNGIILIWLVYFSYTVFSIVVVLVGLVSYKMLRLEPQYISYFVAILIEGGCYYLAYKSKIIRDLREVLTSKNFKSLIRALTVFLVLVISAFRIITSNPENDLFSPIVMVSFVIVLLFIFIVFLSVYMISKNLEEQKVENESEMTQMKELIVDLKEELSITSNEISDYKEKVNDRPISLEHQFKEKLRVINENFRRVSLFFSEQIAEEENIEVSFVLEQLKKSLLDVNEEVAVMSDLSIIESLLIPKTYDGLSALLCSYLGESRNFGVKFYVKNDVIDWEVIEIADAELYPLVGNLINNALKELKKIRSSKKAINVSFSNDNRTFCVTVQDNAGEFPIEILKKLGERGNSTNNTGDGYPEIFKALSKYDASYNLSEYTLNGEKRKFISVTFDGLSHRTISSNYRFNELEKKLAMTAWEVIE